MMQITILYDRHVIKDRIQISIAVIEFLAFA